MGGMREAMVRLRALVYSRNAPFGGHREAECGRMPWVAEYQADARGAVAGANDHGCIDVVFNGGADAGLSQGKFCQTNGAVVLVLSAGAALYEVQKWMVAPCRKTARPS